VESVWNRWRFYFTYAQNGRHEIEGGGGVNALEGGESNQNSKNTKFEKGGGLHDPLSPMVARPLRMLVTILYKKNLAVDFLTFCQKGYCRCLIVQIQKLQ